MRLNASPKQPGRNGKNEKRNAGKAKYDVGKVKQTATGKWREILSAVGGIGIDYLDGKHHPCPRCGGNDRFRLVDESEGACYCNQCFSDQCGDGISAIEWMQGWEFPRALAAVAEYLGVLADVAENVAPTATKKDTRPPADRVDWCKYGQTDFGAIQLTSVLPRWCESKPGVSVASATRYGVRFAKWPDGGPSQHQCLAFCGRSLATPEQSAAVLLYRADGQEFPAFKALSQRKTHLVGGSNESWIWPGTVDDLQSATTIVKCEGTTDALAVDSLGLPHGWMAITNACGAKSANPDKLDFSWAAGKTIIIIGDADAAGQDGARRFAVAFAAACASSVAVPALPYPVSPDHGKDVRDWICEGHGVADLVALAEGTPTATVEELAEWAEKEKKSSKKKTRSDFSNCEKIEVKTEDGETSEEFSPLPMQAIVNNAFEATDHWPRRVGDSLFVHEFGTEDPSGTPSPDTPATWIESPSQLHGWIRTKLGIIRWKSGECYVTKEEFFAEVGRQSRKYDAIESVPHEPPVATHYYTCRPIEPGDGTTLSGLLDFFALESQIDRALLAACFATPLWGGPPGCRPAFMLTCPSGRGKGKSKLAQMLCRVYGGPIDISVQDEMSKIKTRLLSPQAATKRICLLDNVKSTRFSWGELEALITADCVSGHQMFQGEASRPNLLTWIITLNGASLSTDMAQRVVEIRLRDPEYAGDWEARVTSYIDSNRTSILADLITFLRSPRAAVVRHTRWATWEAAVLACVDPTTMEGVTADQCLDAIRERRGQVDVEEEEGEIIEDFFAQKLRWLEYEIDRDDVFIPNEIAVRWFNEATGEKLKSTGVTRALKQFRNEGRIWRITSARMGGDDAARGFRWIGDNCLSSDPTKRDLKKRLADKHEQVSRKVSPGEATGSQGEGQF